MIDDYVDMEQVSKNAQALHPIAKALRVAKITIADQPRVEAMYDQLVAKQVEEEELITKIPLTWYCILTAMGFQVVERFLFRYPDMEVPTMHHNLSVVKQSSPQVD